MKSKKKMAKKLMRLLGDAKVAYNSVMTRLADHDEAFEAMDEGLNKLTSGINELSVGANTAGQDLLQRVKVLEENSIPVKYIKNECNTYHAEVKAIWENHDKRIVMLEQSNEKMNDVLGRSLEKIEQALELTNRRAVDVETLQQQVKEINSRLMALTNKYLELRPTTAPAKVSRTSCDFDSPTATAHGDSVVDRLTQRLLKKPGRNKKDVKK